MTAALAAGEGCPPRGTVVLWTASRRATWRERKSWSRRRDRRERGTKKKPWKSQENLSETTAEEWKKNRRERESEHSRSTCQSELTRRGWTPTGSDPTLILDRPCSIMLSILLRLSIRVLPSFQINWSLSDDKQKCRLDSLRPVDLQCFLPFSWRL